MLPKTAKNLWKNGIAVDSDCDKVAPTSANVALNGFGDWTSMVTHSQKIKIDNSGFFCCRTFQALPFYSLNKPSLRFLN